MNARPQPTQPEPHIPVVTCSHCPWGAGALSVLDTLMLVRAHLHRALQAHLLRAHGVERAAEPPVGEPAKPAELPAPAAALQAS